MRRSDDRLIQVLASVNPNVVGPHIAEVCREAAEALGAHQSRKTILKPRLWAGQLGKEYLQGPEMGLQRLKMGRLVPW